MKGNRGMDTAAKMDSLLVAPAVLYMLIFVGYPMIQNVISSFKNVDVYIFSNATKRNFAGFRSYSELSTGKNSILSRAALNTLIFTVCSVFFQFMIGFGLALLFNKKFPKCSSFRGVAMISWLLLVMVAGLLLKFTSASSGGIINQFLMGPGPVRQPLDWFLKPGLAVVVVVVVNIQIDVPFNMMSLITGLATVPGDIYESTSLDETGKLQTLFLITIPMIKPAIMPMFTLGFVYTLKVFGLVWVMTKDGPMNPMELVSTYARRLSFEELQFSQGAVTTGVLSVILLAVGCFYIKAVSDDEVM